jgi:hypothetical protein
MSKFYDFFIEELALNILVFLFLIELMTSKLNTDNFRLSLLLIYGDLSDYSLKFSIDSSSSS